MSTSSKFGERIRAIRRERGISQKALAEEAGITQGSLSHVEDGTRPISAETIDRLASALQVGPWELVRSTEVEGRYAAARLTQTEAAAHKQRDNIERRLYLALLLEIHNRLFGLCRAVWSHGVCLNDSRHEAAREGLAGFFETPFNALERLGYETIRDDVGIPAEILDSPDTLDDCAGESWEYEYEPLLMRGQRWIVCEFARLGGPLADDIRHAALIQAMVAQFNATVETLKEWDSYIASIEAGNKRYMDRLIATATRYRDSYLPQS